MYRKWFVREGNWHAEQAGKSIPAVRLPRLAVYLRSHQVESRGPDHTDYGTHRSLKRAWRWRRGDATVPLKVKTKPSPTRWTAKGQVPRGRRAGTAPLVALPCLPVTCPLPSLPTEGQASRLPLTLWLSHPDWGGHWHSPTGGHTQSHRQMDITYEIKDLLSC